MPRTHPFRLILRRNRILFRVAILTLELILFMFLFANSLVSDTSDAPPPGDSVSAPSDAAPSGEATTAPSGTTATTTQTAPTTTGTTAPSAFDPGEVQGKKLVALTFDDGPHSTLTPQLLDILAREEVHATFFLLGTNIQRYPDLVRREAADGHQVASHTYNHKQLNKLSAEPLRKEIHDTEDAIAAILGYGPTVMRPPYGAYNSAVIAEANMPLILWSVDPEDWKDPPVEVLCDRLYNSIRDGDIVLLHDIHKNSVAAVEQLIPRLKAAGYAFVTVDQLMTLRDDSVKDVYFSIRPGA